MQLDRVPSHDLSLTREPVADLRTYHRNPRRGDVTVIRRSLVVNGQYRPLVVNRGTHTGRSNEVLAGNHTLAAARDEGWPEIAVCWVDVDDDQAARIVAADNRTADLASYDERLLVELLGDLPDLDGTGYDPGDLEDLVRALEGDEDVSSPNEDDTPEPPSDEDAVTRRGDLWLLGAHRLLCGDSTMADDVVRLMDGQRAPLMATDPPYLVDYQGGNHPQSWANKPKVKDKHWDDYTDPDQAGDFFHRYLAVALEQALTDAPTIYQWHAASRADLVMDAWKRAGLLCHQQIIWVKARAVLGRSHFMWQHEPCLYGWIEGKQPAKNRRPPPDAKTVWQIDQQGNSDGIHPTQKPVETVRRAIGWHTRRGEVVYEPFGGSGTAIIAAEQTGRTCYAMELSPAFCDVIVQRWADATGREPERVEAAAASPTEEVISDGQAGTGS